MVFGALQEKFTEGPLPDVENRSVQDFGIPRGKRGIGLWNDGQIDVQDGQVRRDEFFRPAKMMDLDSLRHPKPAQP